MGKSGSRLSKKELLELLEAMGAELTKRNLKIDIYVYGGTVMCLEYGARESTKDIDASIQSGRSTFLMLARRIADEHNVKRDWLNDDVDSVLNSLLTKGLRKYREFGNLTVYFPSAEQMLAMKIQSRRNYPSHDITDAKALSAWLGIKYVDEACKVYSKFYGEAQLRKSLQEITKFLVERVGLVK